MDARFLTGVSRQASSFQGIELIAVGTDAWYAGSYSLVKGAGFVPIKKELVKTINLVQKRATLEADWQWHHVVETQHLRKVLAGSNLNEVSNAQMPTVLIHRREHIYISQNFNNNEFRELTGTTKKDLKSSPSKDSKTAQGRDKLKARIRNLQEFYSYLYADKPALLKIANNVFGYYISQL